MIDFAETILISPHLLQQYHSDHHLMLPSERDPYLHKIADECMPERNRETSPLRALKGEPEALPIFLDSYSKARALMLFP